MFFVSGDYYYDLFLFSASVVTKKSEKRTQAGPLVQGGLSLSLSWARFLYDVSGWIYQTAGNTTQQSRKDFAA
jgi:hypothetical protein